MKHLPLSLAILLSLGASSQAVTPQPETHFVSTTESLQQYQVPEWYQDAKLGYWVHWGVYSVPAFGGKRTSEWYGRRMYETGSETAEYHLATYGDPHEFGYKDFVPMWKAEKFDADAWADLFQAGGGKFFTMMGMHHDNFPLWDSKTTPFNSVNYGPKKDFVALMEKATRARGMYFGLSNHSAWNSRFFEFNHQNKMDAATSKHSLYGTANPDAEDVAHWWARSTEMVEKYKPDLIWFDGCWVHAPYNLQLRKNYATWFYNQAMLWGMSKNGLPNVVLAHKDQLPEGTAVLDLERGGLKDIHPYVWMNDTSFGNKSWAYTINNETFKSANQIIDMLLDVISKNGILMLNVGPMADGTIPQEVQDRILAIGKWLQRNGEGVYATRPWVYYGEGPSKPGQHVHGDQIEYTTEDVRFTRSKDNKTLYIHLLGYNKDVDIDLLTNKSVLRLGAEDKLLTLESGQEVPYTQDEKGLHFTMPTNLPQDDFAYSFKITFKDAIPCIKE